MTHTATTAGDRPHTRFAGNDRLSTYALLGGALNPDALALFAGVERRIPQAGDGSLLFRELYLQYGAEVLVSGLFRPAVHVEWLPIRIFKLRLQYEGWIWPGFALGRGHGLIFPSGAAPFFPEELERRKGEEIPGFGHRLVLMPTFQAKLWRVVLLDTAELAGWYVHGPEAYWREPLHDNLIRRGALDAVVKNTLLLFFEVWNGGGDRRVMIGGIHEVVHTISAEHTRHRVGPALIVAPFDELWGLSRPTFLFIGGVNAVDTNREGELWMQTGIRVDLDLELPRGP
ncbi:hypothetical protein L6R52_17100 [Myxococcota bacterium]|nr:hypothetical protein [Myxococcota bacterium]